MGLDCLLGSSFSHIRFAFLKFLFPENYISVSSTPIKKFRGLDKPAENISSTIALLAANVEYLVREISRRN